MFESKIEVLVYLASLASNTAAIDPMLDAIRLVTSRSGTTQQDLKILQKTQQQLEDYLIHHDPVRVFTPEELEQKIREHMLTGHFSKLRRALYGVLAVMVVILVGAMAIPGIGDISQRSQLGSWLALLTLSAGAIGFYWTARHNFKPELQPAYTLLCVSSLVLGLSQTQLPIVSYWNLEQAPLFRYGGVSTPTFIAIVCVFLAVRRYAKIVGVPSSPLMSLKVIGPAWIGIAALAVVLPHSSRPENEALFDFSMAVMSANLFTLVLNAMLTRKVAGVSTKIYALPMHLLAASQMTAAIGLTLFLVFLFAKGSLFGATFGILAIPFMVSNVIWLWTSYSFKRATEY